MLTRTRSLKPIQRGERELTSSRRAVIALVMGIIAVMKVGWSDVGSFSLWGAQLDFIWLQGVQIGLLVGYLCTWFFAGYRAIEDPKRQRDFLRITRFELVVVVAGLALCWSWPGLNAVAIILLLVHMTRFYLILVQRKLPPGIVFVGSFVLLIAIGTALLKLPAATPQDHPDYAGISWNDAAFTVTSAISQTGLVVRPTGEGFTRFGQTIIMVWIQVGALGVIVFGALLAQFMGAAFGLRATQTLGEPTEQGWTGQLSLQKLVMFIIVFTHLTEAIGAVVLYYGWPETWSGMPTDMDPANGGTSIDRAFHAVFFSVSAFCNAGFVTTEGSLQAMRTHWVPHLVIAPLVLLGAIGFPVLDNIRRVIVAKFTRKATTSEGYLIRIDLNSKIVLVTAVAVYLLGAGLIFLSELLDTGTSLGVAALDAHFMSIQRTSGFDTVAPNEMGQLSLLGFLFLMFVGGSPGSVAGGIKLVVLFVLSATVYATITGRDETTAFGRTIPNAVVRKCATIIVLCLGLIMLTTGILTLTESDDAAFEVLLFETVSAFGTTGLSLGMTPELSEVGKVAVAVTMFLGRVGVLAVVASLVQVARRNRAQVAYPRGEVVVY